LFAHSLAENATTDAGVRHHINHLQLLVRLYIFCFADCTLLPTTLVCQLPVTNGALPVLTLTAKGSIGGSFDNTVTVSTGGSTDTDTSRVQIFVPTCGRLTPGGRSWWDSNNCPQGSVPNRAAINSPNPSSIVCCVSGSCSEHCMCLYLMLDKVCTSAGYCPPL
jgi:hypothetical protein